MLELFAILFVLKFFSCKNLNFKILEFRSFFPIFFGVIRERGDIVLQNIRLICAPCHFS